MQQRGRNRSAAWPLCGVALAAIVGLAACGGDDDDDAGDADDVEVAVGDAMTADEGAGDAGGSGGGDTELPYGDPCELVPASTVADAVGGDVTGALANADDGLPGATCLYTVAAGGTVSLSVSAAAASFYDGYKTQAESAGGINPVSDLGDDAFVFGGSEVSARAGDAMVQLQVFTSGTTADTGGVEIVRAALEAIGS